MNRHVDHRYHQPIIRFSSVLGDPVAVCPVNGPECDLCGPGHEYPCGDHWTDEMARAELTGWRHNYTPEQIDRWLAAHADRPGARADRRREQDARITCHLDRVLR